MMIKITAADVPRVMVESNKKLVGATKKAARGAALKLRAHLVVVINKSGVNDTAAYKNGLVVVGSTVQATAPHSGFVEAGTRPHKVSREGQAAILSWVMRKLGVKNEEEARRITWAICRKIAREGTEAHWFMRDSLPHAARFYEEELDRILRTALR